FLTKLFRRPATKLEVDRYSQLVQKRFQETRSRDSAAHLLIRSALVSPAFLYLGADEERSDHQEQVLSNLQLAERLSYFLTSGPPDGRMMESVQVGRLTRADVLTRHADRLLRSKSSAPFVEAFTTQWLGLDKLDSLMPDPGLLKNFAAGHREGLRQEPIATFGHILNNNLSVVEFICPDYVFTNGAVGKDIYEFDAALLAGMGKSKRNVQLVSVDPGDYRGGLLGMPGVMMATANGVDTQPVLRGVWALENILGSPIPEPPKSVPALTPDTTGAKSPKEKLAAHMSDASCAACHRHIDPVGFVLESYDAIGRWRTHYTKTEKQRRSPGPKAVLVDSAGTLPNGVALQDVTDLKQWLADHPELFAQCLAEKLLTYATGHPLSFRERSIITEVVTKQKQENDLRLRNLIVALVDSKVFRAR
ncbi:MAG: DUF1588 domain-containing protein, partial [Planctomycetota bacterium]